MLFLALLVLLSPEFFLGLFVLIATGSVGQQRFQMRGGWHGVEMVMGGKKKRDTLEDVYESGDHPISYSQAPSPFIEGLRSCIQPQSIYG